MGDLDLGLGVGVGDLVDMRGFGFVNMGCCLYSERCIALFVREQDGAKRHGMEFFDTRRSGGDLT